ANIRAGMAVTGTSGIAGSAVVTAVVSKFTQTATGNFNPGSGTLLTNLPATTNITAGMGVSGPGIQTGTTVASVIPSFTSSGLTNTINTALISGFSASDIAKIVPGMAVTGTGVPIGATVLTNNSFTLPGTTSTATPTIITM